MENESAGMCEVALQTGIAITTWRMKIGGEGYVQEFVNMLIENLDTSIATSQIVKQAEPERGDHVTFRNLPNIFCLGLNNGMNIYLRLMILN